MPSPPSSTRRRRRSQPERSAATRRALVSAARPLFAQYGFAGVSTEVIVAAARVTRGALYHHFADKIDLFAAVVEAVEADVAEQLARVGAANGAADPIEVMRVAARAWLTACASPEVHRIVLVDGPSVLGWAVARWPKRWTCSSMASRSADHTEYDVDAPRLAQYS